MCKLRSDVITATKNFDDAVQKYTDDIMKLQRLRAMKDAVFEEYGEAEVAELHALRVLENADRRDVSNRLAYDENNLIGIVTEFKDQPLDILSNKYASASAHVVDLRNKRTTLIMSTKTAKAANWVHKYAMDTAKNALTAAEAKLKETTTTKDFIQPKYEDIIIAPAVIGDYKWDGVDHPNTKWQRLTVPDIQGIDVVRWFLKNYHLMGNPDTIMELRILDNNCVNTIKRSEIISFIIGDCHDLAKAAHYYFR